MKPNLAQLRRLVGNPDAYALQLADGTWRPKREPITPAILAKHLRGSITVGTYVGHNVDGESVSRTLVFDFDTGDQAQAEASACAQACHELGLPASAVSIEFSGRKGYHVWVLLAENRPLAELRRVGRAVLALADLPANVEVFPKQDRVRDLGNLVKLPGGVHQVTGNHNDFCGPVPVPFGIPGWKALVESLPEEQRARSVQADNRFPCLATIQEGVAEGGRNSQLFHLAAMFRRHGAEDALVGAILEHVNSRCDPPVEDEELAAILESSRSSGAVCGQLPRTLRESCGELCIQERLNGLAPRPGVMKFAAEGEPVVVTVSHSSPTSVKLDHPDLSVVATGSLREKQEDA